MGNNAEIQCCWSARQRDNDKEPIPGMIDEFKSSARTESTLSHAQPANSFYYNAQEVETNKRYEKYLKDANK